MHRVVAIGRDDSIQIFTLIGFEVYITHSADFESLLMKLTSESVAIIYVTESLMSEHKAKIKSFQAGGLPAVIAIPQGLSLGVGSDHISKLAEKAIGMDMF